MQDLGDKKPLQIICLQGVMYVGGTGLEPTDVTDGAASGSANTATPRGTGSGTVGTRRRLFAVRCPVCGGAFRGCGDLRPHLRRARGSGNLRFGVVAGHAV